MEAEYITIRTLITTAVPTTTASGRVRSDQLDRGELRGPREHDHGHSDRLGQSEPGVDGGDAGDESERDDPEQQRRHVSDAGPDVTVRQRSCRRGGLRPRSLSG